ncbi:hypothetical protein [Deinococcus ficus]|uniref:Uncharacterized protein n=1 Tax=Deinococcus ficus TaxID=317577 RepID=A0A221T2N5_9DEIO|nr:hypothetical protein [Deinococcus ficus]ASN83162.1 hypothetical protein DFI_18350 [Deinococcus ficus]
MSQHTFSRPGHHVSTGWSRRQRNFFLIIRRGDQAVYDHRLDPEATRGGLSLEQIQERLDEHRIVAPPGLLNALQDDLLHNRGGHEECWDQ